MTTPRGRGGNRGKGRNGHKISLNVSLLTVLIFKKILAAQRVMQNLHSPSRDQIQTFLRCKRS